MQDTPARRTCGILCFFYVRLGLKSGFSHRVGGTRMISATRKYWPFIGSGAGVALGAWVLPKKRRDGGADAPPPGFENTRSLPIVGRFSNGRTRSQSIPVADFNGARASTRPRLALASVPRGDRNRFLARSSRLIPPCPKRRLIKALRKFRRARRLCPRLRPTPGLCTGRGAK